MQPPKSSCSFSRSTTKSTTTPLPVPLVFTVETAWVCWCSSLAEYNRCFSESQGLKYVTGVCVVLEQRERLLNQKNRRVGTFQRKPALIHVKLDFNFSDFQHKMHFWLKKRQNHFHHYNCPPAIILVIFFSFRNVAKLKLRNVHSEDNCFHTFHLTVFFLLLAEPAVVQFTEIWIYPEIYATSQLNKMVKRAPGSVN